MDNSGKPVSRRAALTLGASTAAGGAVAAVALAGGSPTAWAAPIVRRAVGAPAAAASPTLNLSVVWTFGADSIAAGQTVNCIGTIHNLSDQPAYVHGMTLFIADDAAIPVRWGSEWVSNPLDIRGVPTEVQIVNAPDSLVMLLSPAEDLVTSLSMTLAPYTFAPGERLNVGFRIERDERYVVDPDRPDSKRPTLAWSAAVAGGYLADRNHHITLA